MNIPRHLKKYIVEQNYGKYTAEDQAVWRYIMGQIRAILSGSGHKDCLRGIEAVGITYDKIPHIARMDRELKKFNWRAVPVSGFIPPRAFMDFQIHGILPVASELRTVHHIGYTPAPDIVHEAVGHVPFLMNPVFSRFLKTYAGVVKKALVSREDIKLYTAVRALSDLKENPRAREEEIKKQERELKKIGKGMSHISEASSLSRFIWWTSEYGLRGNLKNPKIYGAGLISSVSEARHFLSKKVKVLPLTADCLNYSYDITKFQPQLFITPDFERLLTVLEEIAQNLSYRKGGIFGLRRAVRCQTVNTLVLDSGLQISGCVERFSRSGESAVFVRLKGPVQLSFQGGELTGQGTAYHREGYSTPLQWMGQEDNTPPYLLTAGQLRRRGLSPGKTAEIKFAGNITLRGEMVRAVRKAGRLLLITFKNCQVRRGAETLFHPNWGPFDLGVGARVTSVFSGPADEDAYGLKDSFCPSVVARRRFSKEEKSLFRFYRDIEDLKAVLPAGKSGGIGKAGREKRLKALVDKLCLSRGKSRLWPAGLELLSAVRDFPEQKARVEACLDFMAKNRPAVREHIRDGRRVLQ